MNPYEASRVKLRRTSAELAAIDEAIISAVAADKPVTLRGVFYRVVSAGAVEKTEKGYDLIGRRLLGLRRAGRVGYADIADGTRWVQRPRTWTSADDALQDAADSYRRSLWHDRPVSVHLFTEKDAISGVVSNVTDELDVPLGVVRGYSSETFTWGVARSIIGGDREAYVYQLGDHDPSGVDAWRSFSEKVAEFIGGRALVHFERLAVTPDQITEYGLLTRPTKPTDTRAAKFTGESVEVDAIPAPELRSIVREAVMRHISERDLADAEAAEESEREILRRLAEGYNNE